MSSMTHLRAFTLLFSLGLFAAAAGCSKSRAIGVRPNMVGTWDVTYDDVIEVELRVRDQVHRARVPATGGRVALYDAGQELELEIDCSRPELVCPAEVWPQELALDNRTGDIDDEGDKFALSFEGEGKGSCRARGGSLVAADLESSGSPSSRNWEAAAMTSGQVTTVVGIGCLARSSTELPSDAEVSLSTGFTAARR